MIGPVSIHGVSLDAEILQPLTCPGLAGPPSLAQAAGPIDGGFKAQVPDRNGTGPFLRSRKLLWRGCGFRGSRLSKTGAPERREHPKRLSVVVQDSSGLEEEVARTALRDDSSLAGLACQFLIAGDGGRFIAPIPEDGFRSGLSRELEQCFRRGSETNDQLGAAQFQRVSQTLKRLMQPPSRCSSRGPRGVFFRRPDEDRYDRTPERVRAIKRRVVSKTQVGTKPDESGSFFHLCRSENSTAGSSQNRVDS